MIKKFTMSKTDKQNKTKIIEVVKKIEGSGDTDSNYTEPHEKPPHKPRKSLFAALIRRKKIKTPKVKIETFSGIKYDPAGSAENNDFLSNTDSEQSSIGSKRKHGNFLKKIMRSSRSAGSQESMERALVPKALGLGTSASSCFNLNNAPVAYIQNFIPTTYLPKHDLKLINGINELQDILQNLHKSEDHLVNILRKYIKDESCQKQLMRASFEYFANEYDSKCQTSALADDLWRQQLEMTRAQEKSLQKKIVFLVKENRRLQCEMENLCRQCEKYVSRINLPQKRLQQARPFGKTYLKHLLETNKKLQSKIKDLTALLEDFEEEMQRLQEQAEGLEEEKRNMKSQVYNLEGLLDRTISNVQVEKAFLINQAHNFEKIIKEGANVCNLIFQNFGFYERQIRELGISINWTRFQDQEYQFPELISQIRFSIEGLVPGLISAYRNATSAAKDLGKLRDTNTRLQENLYKSTSELDNLSRKLERNVKDGDGKVFELKCLNLEEEVRVLKDKMEKTSHENLCLKDQIEYKDKSITEANETVHTLVAEKHSLKTQIDDFLKIILQVRGSGDAPRDLMTSQDKLEYFRSSCLQIHADKKFLAERCHSLEEENRSMYQDQDMFQHEIGALQDALNLLSSENDIIKKQLDTEHQTVLSLQSERIKYLEEKNMLKAIFQHLKLEVSRVQQLEGAVADMSKETSRLALIAEFNKQLGEQLKSEVEMKDNAIVELRQSLEKLSHLQQDNDKEKVTLCAQLTEIATVKEKLSDCLEMEVKKNLELGDCNKQLEFNTKSQIKLFEEMQKNERAALKELLKDFKSLIKQRDTLLKLQEHTKKKILDMEKHVVELQKNLDSVIALNNDKEIELKQLLEKLQEQDGLIKKLEEKYKHCNSKYDKNIHKFEKLIAQTRGEKDELESTVTYLKTNIQKANSDLNQARQNEAECVNKLNLKMTELSTIEAELIKYKDEVKSLNQDNGKLNMELDYLRKLSEKQSADLENTLNQNSTKDSFYQEAKCTLLGKQFEVDHQKNIICERENQLRCLDQELSELKKQNQDLNKILIGYEDQLIHLPNLERVNLKLENDLHNLEEVHKATVEELATARFELNNFSKQLSSISKCSEDEKSFYKCQAQSLLAEYNEEKQSIQREISSISMQLHEVTQNLHSEKLRFEEISTSHEELKKRYHLLKDNISAEINSHKMTCRKMGELEEIIKSVEAERDELQQQIHMLVMEVNDEKAANLSLTKENEKLHTILEQGRQQYNAVLSRNALLEKELRESKYELDNKFRSKEMCAAEANKSLMDLHERTFELEAAKETIDGLRKELHESQKALFDLREEFFKLQQQVTGLEFKNCELTLQLHETRGKLETERSLYKELKSEQSQSNQFLEEEEELQEDYEREEEPVVPPCGN